MKCGMDCLFIKNGEKIDYKKGDTLFQIGDEFNRIYLLDEGIVKLVNYNQEGDEYIMHLACKEDFVALLLLIQKKTEYPVSAICVTDVVLNEIDVNVVSRMKDKSTMIQSTCINCAAERLNLFHGNLNDQVGGSLEQRLLTVLKLLYSKFGHVINDEYRLELPITKTELASMVGARRETVSRALKKLMTQGELKIKGNTVILNEID